MKIIKYTFKDAKERKKRTFIRQRKSYIYRKYGLIPEKFYNLWSDQNGLCKTCAIQLIDRMYIDEMYKFKEDENLEEYSDYALAQIDHNHDMDGTDDEKIHPNYIRGILCKRCNMVYDSLNVKSPFYVGEDEKLKNILKIDRLNNPYNAISLYVLESFGYTEGSDFGRIDVWQENRKLYWSLREKEVIDSLTEKRSEYNVFS